MPVQLYEAWTALIVGGAALATVLAAGPARSGPVAVIGLAAYTLIRQGILGLRDEASGPVPARVTHSGRRY
jgi:prolipoprotein diacylglyceryltransferase